MSGVATRWAFRQRGLPPATKIVLLCLADCHNAATGRCEPDVASLCEMAEVSRRSIFRHLDALEARGLIHRVPQFHPQSGEQASNSYILRIKRDQRGAEAQYVAGGGVPNWHGGRGAKLAPQDLTKEDTTTPRAAGAVDKSDRVAAAEARCLAAAGPGLCAKGRAAIPTSRAVVAEWLAEGIDLEADVLPVIAERTARPRGRPPIVSWAYFTEAVRSARRRRLARVGKAPPCASPGSIDHLASWINSGRYVPPSAVTNTMRDELLARGLVQAEALRALQIY